MCTWNQEYNMPIKRTTSKKKKTTTKKVASRKKTTTKKTVAKKKVPAKKKATKKVAAKKKATAKKTTTKKTAAKKKSTAKKKTTKKVAAKKKSTAKRTTTKKTAAKKKVTAKKKATKKVATKKKTTTKGATTKKTTAKKKVVKSSTIKRTASSKKPEAKKETTFTSKINKVSQYTNTNKELEQVMSNKNKPDLPTVTQPAPVINKQTVAEKIEAKKAAPMVIESTYNQEIVGPVATISPYKPGQGEEYMNEAQLEHFTTVLFAWRRQVMEGVDKTVGHLRDDAENYADPNDRATQEEEFSLELRTRDRERKLLKKIEQAIQRIRENDFGYCEACGVEIGLPRLEVRPTATLCIDCKTVEEIREKQITL